MPIVTHAQKGTIVMKKESPILLNIYARLDITVPKTLQGLHQLSNCVQRGITVQQVHPNPSRARLGNTVRRVRSVIYHVNQKTVPTGPPMEFTAPVVAKNQNHVQLVANARRVNRWCYLFYVNLAHGNH